MLNLSLYQLEVTKKALGYALGSSMPQAVELTLREVLSKVDEALSISRVEGSMETFTFHKQETAVSDTTVVKPRMLWTMNEYFQAPRPSCEGCGRDAKERSEIYNGGDDDEFWYCSHQCGIKWAKDEKDVSDDD